MSQGHRVIRSRRVLLPDGLHPASINMINGLIESVGRHEVSGAEDFGNLVIMPGLIDTHVHFEGAPGGNGEGFAAITQAAAAGGVTTIIGMPWGGPDTRSEASLESSIKTAEGHCWVDVGFWAALAPDTGSALHESWKAGCFGFECSLDSAGAEQPPGLSEADLRTAMQEIASLGGVLLVDAAHLAEHPSGATVSRYSDYLASLPRPAEKAAAELLIRLSRESGCRSHVLHIGSAQPLSELSAARSIGVPVTAETCPHYLTFAAEEIGDGATEFKCSPPIRESYNRDAIWLAMTGQINMIVSDHMPPPLSMKPATTGDFASAWAGIASVELGLAAVWTEARYRDFSIADVARWMCTGPAKLAGLEHRKGLIAPGYDADLVIWHPEAGFIVDPGRMRQRQKQTPYAGRRLSGKVQQTILRGRTVELDGAPGGQILRRSDIRNP